MAKKPRLSERSSIFKKIYYHPLGFTGMSFTLGIGYSLFSDVQNPIVPAITVGLLGDGLRALSVNYRIRKLNRSNSKLEKSLDKDYLEGIIKSVRKELGYTGNCKITETMEKQDGTGVLQRGYLADLKLDFEDGNSARLLFKYHDKGDDIGAVINSVLFENGMDFVPRRIKQGSMSKLDDMYPNRGQFYEFFEGETLEDKIHNGEGLSASTVKDVFDRMNKVYSLTNINVKLGIAKYLNHNLSRHKFHKNLMQNIGVDNEFAKILNEEYIKIFKNVGLKLIHGDLHLGNIMQRDDEMKIIDWDSANHGLPYSDFFYFSVISDFEKSSEYRDVRKKFLQNPGNIIKGAGPRHQMLTEFEVYFTLLNRYYKAIDKKEIKKEHIF